MKNILKLLGGIFAVAISLNVFTPSQAAAYTYVSNDYGYSIECPEKPLGVIPLIDPKQKGEVLVFKNDGYTILEGWIIATNAFDADQIPNFDKMTDKDAQKYAANFIMSSNGRYQTALFIPVNGRKVLYAIAPQEAYVDADKKDKADKSDQPNVSQRIETYLPGKKTNYAIVFFKSGTVDAQDSIDYQKGILSFKETSDNAVADKTASDAPKDSLKK